MKKEERDNAIFVVTVCLVGAIGSCSIPYFFRLFVI